MRQPKPVSAAAQQQVSLTGLSVSDATKAAELKNSIARLAGSKNGNDLPPERHAEIKQLLQQLEGMNPADKVHDKMIKLEADITWSGPRSRVIGCG
jgi:hypothetical protein